MAMSGQSISAWSSLEQFAYADVSYSETGASPLEAFRMLIHYSRRLWTSTIFLILSKSMPVSANFVSINCPFHMAPLVNSFFVCCGGYSWPLS